MIKSKGRRGRLGYPGADLEAPHNRKAVAAPDPSSLAWRDLVSLASDMGVLRAGMNRKAVETAVRRKAG